MPRIRTGILRTLRLKLRSRQATRSELDEELRFHLEARTEQLIAGGMEPEPARQEARRRLGLDSAVGAALYRSAERRDRQLQRSESLSEWTHDLRYALRGLVGRPGFTAVAVLTLALGLGGSTALFSAVYALLLRPLPFQDPDALMRVVQVRPGTAPVDAPQRESVWSYPKYEALREAQSVFTEMAVYTSAGPAMLETDHPERVRGEVVGAGYFSLLGVTMQLGRAFTPEEDEGPGSRKLVVLGDALWRSQFGGDSSTVGRSVVIDGEPLEVIGVAPPGFRGLTGRSEVFLPVMRWPASELSQPYSHIFNVVARRRGDVSSGAASAATVEAGARVAERYPGSDASEVWSARATPLDNARVAPRIRRSVWVLFGAVGFVLLVVCVNVANLLMGRWRARRADFAVRQALGASRARLSRLVLTESLLLSTLGGVAGVGVAALGTMLLRRVDPIALLRSNALGLVDFSTIHLEPLPLLFGLTLAGLTGVLFGLVPAYQAGRASVVSTLKEGGAGVSGTRSRSWGRATLVVVEVAMAVVLLAGSGLMLRSLAHLLSVDPGFDEHRPVMTADLSAAPGATPRDSLPGFYPMLAARLEGLAGVESVGFALCPPLSGGCATTVMTFEDRPDIALDQAPEVGVHRVTGGWFRTVGVPLLQGRVFGEQDGPDAPQVVLVNRTAAERFWPGESPVGKRIAIYSSGFDDGATVVGVVGDVLYDTPERGALPDVYVPLTQAPHPRPSLFVRTNPRMGDPSSLLRAELRAAAPGFAVEDVRSLEDRTADATAQARFGAVLLTGFAAVALSLALLGIYGVMSFSVLQRRHEMGVRMALGADRERVLRLVLGRGLTLTLTGLVLGALLAAVLTRALQSLLFQVAPTDPGVYAGITGVLLLTGLAASWLPAWRAARFDPVSALRG
ncbi:MAG: ABC transporter permease [Gemmatimonadota bacterium]